MGLHGRTLAKTAASKVIERIVVFLITAHPNATTDMPATFLRTFLAILLTATVPVTSLYAADKRPNVIVILVDDLGYGDLSCYGATDLQSPNIDALFKAGARFDQFYANCPVCSPSRASLMTGLYPDRAGVPGVIRTPLPGRPTSWGKLREDIPLLPEVLKTAGYHSALVGKWHLGMEKPDRPHDRGFDLFHGFLGDMMDDYYHHRRHDINYMRRNDEVLEPEGHATDLFSDWAIDYLNERTGTAPDQPFFLYLAYNAPHTPIQPPEDWLEKVKQREPGIDPKRAALVALIEHLDHGIGRVHQAVKDLGIADDTLIIFSSDNGGQSSVGARNEPWHGGKQDMWEGGIRVGTCAVWPGKIPVATYPDHISLTMDIFPTVAEVAGAEIDHAIDGRSFLPVLLGKPFEDKDRALKWVRLEGNQKYGGIPYHAIRIGDYKLLRNTAFEPYQMFNIKADPHEDRPIPRQKAPKKYDELFNTLMTHINEAGRYPWQRENP